MEISVISGFQTGADLGGVEAAKELGLKTGGSIPKGFKNHNGNNPEFANLYGAIEHKSPAYPPRTYENAKNSDGTLRFAVDFTTAGEVCTLKGIKQYNKPYLDIRLDKGSNITPNENSIKFVVNWIVKNNIKTLNIAGNSNKTHSLIQTKVKNFMLEVLKKIKEI